MAQLAIQGHATRGSEVIALLEMLGGKIRRDRLAGDELFSWYYINGNGYIDYKHYSLFNDTTCFTLEEFEENFPYKVGDMARLSRSNVAVIIKTMKWEKDEIVYQLSCDDSGWWGVNNLKPYREKTMETKKITITPQFHWNEDKIELEVTNDYEIKEENGKFYAVKKQSKYPKNYVECCDVIGLHQLETPIALGYKAEIIETLQQLLICRDAYWKIAGDWKPEWLVENKYTIHTSRDKIVPSTICNANTILVFPTKEMRDAFYENFKELIETCKELL